MKLRYHFIIISSLVILFFCHLIYDQYSNLNTDNKTSLISKIEREYQFKYKLIEYSGISAANDRALQVIIKNSLFDKYYKDYLSDFLGKFGKFGIDGVIIDNGKTKYSKLNIKNYSFKCLFEKLTEFTLNDCDDLLIYYQSIYSADRFESPEKIGALYLIVSKSNLLENYNSNIIYLGKNDDQSRADIMIDNNLHIKIKFDQVNFINKSTVINLLLLIIIFILFYYIISGAISHSVPEIFEIEELKNMKDDYLQILQLIPVPIYIVNSKDEYFYCNFEFCKIIGKTRESLIGNKILPIPNITDYIFNQTEIIINKEELKICSLYDISNQKELETKRIQLEHIINLTNCITVKWNYESDLERRILFISNNIEKMGYKIKNNSSVNLQKIIHVDDIQKMNDEFIDCYKNFDKDQYEIEFRIYDKIKNDFIWFRESGFIKRDIHKIPLYVESVLVDIHDNKILIDEIEKLNISLEEKVRDRTLKLQQGYETINDILENLLNGVIIVAKNMSLLYVNPYAKELMRTNGHLDNIFDRETSERIVNFENFETSFVKDGNKHEVSIVSSEIIYYGEKAILCSISDINSMKEKEDELRVLNALLLQMQKNSLNTITNFMDTVEINPDEN